MNFLSQKHTCPFVHIDEHNPHNGLDNRNLPQESYFLHLIHAQPLKLQSNGRTLLELYRKHEKELTNQYTNQYFYLSIFEVDDIAISIILIDTTM